MYCFWIAVTVLCAPVGNWNFKLGATLMHQNKITAEETTYSLTCATGVWKLDLHFPFTEDHHLVTGKQLPVVNNQHILTEHFKYRLSSYMNKSLLLGVAYWLWGNMCFSFWSNVLNDTCLFSCRGINKLPMFSELALKLSHFVLLDWFNFSSLNLE